MSQRIILLLLREFRDGGRGGGQGWNRGAMAALTVFLLGQDEDEEEEEKVKDEGEFGRKESGQMYAESAGRYSYREVFR